MPLINLSSKNAEEYEDRLVSDYPKHGVNETFSSLGL